MVKYINRALSTSGNMLLVVLFASFGFIHASTKVCETFEDDQKLPGLESPFYDHDGVPLDIVFTCKIHGSGRKDSGNYTCEARTTDGIFLYNEIMDIRIKDPVQKNAERRRIQPKANDSPSLSCFVKGHPYSVITWQFEFESKVADLTNLTITAYNYANGTINSLNLTSVVQGSDGSYRCDAHYSRQPPIVELIHYYVAKAVGTDVVYLAWELYTTEEVLSTRIMYKKNGTEDWCFHSEKFIEEYGSEIVEGLENGTAYQFQILVTSPAGYSRAAYSPWITTWEEDFIPTVWTTATTHHSISIAWSEPPEKLNYDSTEKILADSKQSVGIRCNRRCLVYKITAIHTKDETLRLSRYSYDVASYTIDDLESNVYYEIKVAVCIYGPEPHQCSNHSSPPRLAATIDRDPKFVPTVTVEDPTPDSIRIGWSAPPVKLQGRVHQYKVAATRPGEREEPIYFPKTVNSIVLKNLIPRTNYAVRVAACSSYKTQCGDWSAEQLILTTYPAPKFVPEIEIMDTSLNSISVGWSALPPELQDRVYQYKVAATRRGDTEMPVYLPQTVNSYVFENLTSSTSYLVKIALCGDHEMRCGNWSDTKEVLTVINQAGNTRDAIWASTVAVAGVVLGITMVTWMAIRKRSEMAARRRFIEATLERFNQGDLECLDPEVNIADQAELLPYDKKWEFPRELLKLGKVLGNGAFGIVRKAEAKSICQSELVTTVAVKLVRSTSSLDHMTALSRELKILIHLGKHLNVVNLLGACTKKVSFGQLMVIVDFCRFGNLHHYLLHRREDFINQINTVGDNINVGSSCGEDLVSANDSGSMDTEGCDNSSGVKDSSHSTDSTNTSMAVCADVTDADPVEPIQLSNYRGDYRDENLKPISTRDLLSWSWQVACGMKYLGFRTVVHGDLAARNILLADNNVVKICDFGLAKTLYANENYQKKGHGPLPVKWLAIESLRDRVFSIHSDVWAYGVVLFEFFSLAETPYPGVPPDTLYKKLLDGFRMPQPKYATRDIYDMMLRCWDAEPSRRPSFNELADSMSDLLDDSVKTQYFDLSGPYVRMNAEALKLGAKDYLTMTPSKDQWKDTVKTSVRAEG